MASSENPLSITETLLFRLGLGCRSYNGPDQTALHRVLITTLFLRLFKAKLQINSTADMCIVIFLM